MVLFVEICFESPQCKLQIKEINENVRVYALWIWAHWEVNPGFCSFLRQKQKKKKHSNVYIKSKPSKTPSNYLYLPWKYLINSDKTVTINLHVINSKH